MKKGETYYCWWMGRELDYTGREGFRPRRNSTTRAIEKKHCYIFTDTLGATIEIFDDKIPELEKRA